MKSSALTLFLFLTASTAFASAVPGVRPELLGGTAGFASSIAVDSRGNIYYTTTAGSLFRFDVPTKQSLPIAQVDTVALGDSGLLGMALLDDNTAVVHYTTPGQTYDVISKIDLTTGAETELRRFVADITFPGRGTSGEHHGGNPSVAADGSVFVAIGDYGGGLIASMPEWNAGKVWRIYPDGRAEQFARGVRNPFDMAFDVTRQRLFLPDNGAAVDDELNVISSGANCGWPFTAGKGPAVDGDASPLYVFPRIVAPTGVVHLSGRNRMFRSGYLIGAFVSKAIYWIPDIDMRPLPDPIPLIQGETSFVIDVAEGGDGEIYFTTGSGIYHLAIAAPRLRAVRAGG
jgi:glucose/arabinose dehydrogenase